MKIQPLTGKWQFRQVGAEEWLPASVPGGVHTDLMANGRIPDPFTADNEKRLQWVAESDWVYRTSFTCADGLISEDKVYLVCDGLDTLASVVLNGHELGRTDNMFRRYEWEVKTFLTAKGANELIGQFLITGEIRCGGAGQASHCRVSPRRSTADRTCAKLPVSSAGIGDRSSRPSESGRISAWKVTAGRAWRRFIFARIIPADRSRSGPGLPSRTGQRRRWLQ